MALLLPDVEHKFELVAEICFDNLILILEEIRDGQCEIEVFRLDIVFD